MKHFAYDLKQMQSLPLEAKIRMTQERIRQWYEYWEGDVYISFSGGKDSTVLLHLVRSLYPEVEAAFCDTGLEYPEIREFVKTVDNVTWLKPTKNFKQVIMEYGYPVASKEISRKVHYAKKGSEWAVKCITGEGKPSRYCISKRWLNLLNAPFDVHDYCCYVMKKQPFAKYQKESNNKPIVATMAAESSLRTQGWLKTGCNSFNSKKPMSKPMSFWTNRMF